MAKAKDTMYKTAEEAREACLAENAAVKEVGRGKERRVFRVETKSADGLKVEGFVVHTMAGKARAVGALAIGLQAIDVDRPARGPGKTLLEMVAVANQDELDNVRKLLAQLDAARAATVIPPAEPVKKTHKAK